MDTPASIVDLILKKEDCPPLTWIDMSNWDDEPAPQRRWTILDRVPPIRRGCSPAKAAPAKASSS